ncbi:hypothetical protein WAX88_15365 [Photobacterium damselae subsp. damselae]|uniref:HNH endonuclease 5 domain-containing protein n=1 Tax=Photobacterium damselae subsp. damselae TaxID=85581 RepID=A0A850R8E9_PHODD|nr:hypothetical protein [Photobacterium damselae subsp. damselae]
MIANNICPYCSTLMVKGENLPNGRSVEHLVPNTVLTCKRNNGEGDFYACRKCNCNKGNLDEIFGLIAKCQSDNSELAVNSLIRAFTKRKNVPQRYLEMFDSAQEKGGLVEAKMPVYGQELIDYATYFGKGLYFLKYGRVFNEKREVMHIRFFNKQVHMSHAQSYQKSLSSNPIRDLESNSYSWVVAEDECVIWSKNRSHLIVFHHFISFGIKFKNRNRKTAIKQRELEKNILDSFG